MKCLRYNQLACRCWYWVDTQSKLVNCCPRCPIEQYKSITVQCCNVQSQSTAKYVASIPKPTNAPQAGTSSIQTSRHAAQAGTSSIPMRMLLKLAHPVYPSPRMLLRLAHPVYPSPRMLLKLARPLHTRPGMLLKLAPPVHTSRHAAQAGTSTIRKPTNATQAGTWALCSTGAMVGSPFSLALALTMFKVSLYSLFQAASSRAYTLFGSRLPALSKWKGST